MPETKDFYVSRPVVYSIENLEWWQRELPNTGKVSVPAAFVRCLGQTQGGIKQVIAKRPSRRRIGLRDVGNNLGEVRYGWAGDFDSEIHWGMSARISSMDLASAG